MGTTDEPKGTQPTGEPPEGKKETPTGQYTDADVKLAVHKALSEAGRTETKLTAREKSIQTKEQEIQRWQEEKDAAELKAADGNPEVIDAINLRKQIREAQKQLAQDKAQLEQEKQTHQADIEESKQTKQDIKVFTIAEKFGVSANTLKEKALRYKLESDEDIEDLAKTLKPSTQEEINPDPNIVTGQTTDFAKVDFGNNAPSAGEMISKGLKKNK